MSNLGLGFTFMCVWVEGRRWEEGVRIIEGELSPSKTSEAGGEADSSKENVAADSGMIIDRFTSSVGANSGHRSLRKPRGAALLGGGHLLHHTI